MSRDKQIDVIYEDLVEIFDEEYNRRNLITPQNAAERMTDKGYRKSTELAEEIFAEIEFEIHQLDFDREETRAIAIEGIIANAKKKYIGEDTNVTTNTEEGK